MSYIILIICTIFIIVGIVLITITGNSNENFKIDGIDVSDKMTRQDIIKWKHAQKKMTNMLNIFVKICKKYKLKKWWVSGGTFIGTVRHKGWIAWDGDLAIAMLEEDYNIFKKNVQKELPNDMWFQSRENDKHYKSNIAKIRDLNSCYLSPIKNWHNGLQLDIFIYKQNKDRLIPLVKMGDSREYKKNFILPTKQLKFENITVNVPNKFKEFSKLNYRDFPPALPEKSKRRPHEGGGHIDPFYTCKHHYKMYPKLYK